MSTRADACNVWLEWTLSNREACILADAMQLKPGGSGGRHGSGGGDRDQQPQRRVMRALPLRMILGIR